MNEKNQNYNNQGYDMNYSNGNSNGYNNYNEHNDDMNYGNNGNNNYNEPYYNDQNYYNNIFCADITFFLDGYCGIFK